MKPQLIVFLTFLLLGSVSSQTQQKAAEPQTKLETFQARTGSVLIKNFSEIGSLNGLGGTLTVTSYEFADAQSGKKEYGVGIAARESERLGRENRSYVDYDEIESLLAGVDYVSKIDGSQSKLKKFEAHYRTKGELDVTVFSSRERIEAAVSVGRISAVRVFLQLDALPKFRQLIVDAKTAIDLAK